MKEFTSSFNITKDMLPPFGLKKCNECNKIVVCSTLLQLAWWNTCNCCDECHSKNFLY